MKLENKNIKKAGKFTNMYKQHICEEQMYQREIKRKIKTVSKQIKNPTTYKIPWDAAKAYLNNITDHKNPSQIQNILTAVYTFFSVHMEHFSV